MRTIYIIIGTTLFTGIFSEIIKVNYFVAFIPVFFGYIIGMVNGVLTYEEQLKDFNNK